MEDFATITHDELQNKIDSEDDFALIDTLGEMSYQRAHLPGAISISAKEDDFVEQVAAALPDKSKEIIVYCGSFSCGLSPKAAEELTEAGYKNVVDYEGGLKDWADHGHEFEGEEAETVRESLAEADQ